jgi:hypothetical protein
MTPLDWEDATSIIRSLRDRSWTNFMVLPYKVLIQVYK